VYDSDNNEEDIEQLNETELSSESNQSSDEEEVSKK
jgi:hypothetical protein